MREHVHVSHYMIVSYREACTQKDMSVSSSGIHNRAMLGSGIHNCALCPVYNHVELSITIQYHVVMKNETCPKSKKYIRHVSVQKMRHVSVQKMRHVLVKKMRHVLVKKMRHVSVKKRHMTQSKK